MANAAWPPSLPQGPLLEGYNESFPDNVVRTAMSTGPPKIRQRSTAGVRELSWNMILTTAQLATLETFFNTTIAGGSLPFDLIDPRTNVLTAYQFAGPPTFSPISDLHWKVRLELAVLP